MTYSYDKLPDYSRIWIFQSDRKLTEKEVELMQQMADDFVVEWVAHGKDLHAGAKVLFNQFLILSVNEKVNGASGCSIDASIRFIKKMEDTFNVKLMDRSKIAYLESEEIKLVELGKVKDKIDHQTITADTLIFNNLVETKGALNDQWLIPAKDSWMKKYFMIHTRKNK